MVAVGGTDTWQVGRALLEISTLSGSLYFGYVAFMIIGARGHIHIWPRLDEVLIYT